MRLEELKPHEDLVIRIDGLGYTGEGFARLEDGWLSVKGSLPGELVRVRPQPLIPRSRRQFADLLEVIEPSPDRREPLCSEYGRCQGCQLRHMSIEAELRYKAEAIEEVVQKFANVPRAEQPPTRIIAPQPLHRGDAVRRRTALHYRRRQDVERGFELGLIAPRRANLVAMSSCPILTMPVRRTIEVIEEVIAGLPNPLPDAEGVARSSNSAQTASSDSFASPADMGLQAIHVACPRHGQGWIDLQWVVAEELFTRLEADSSPPLRLWALEALITQLDQALPMGLGIFLNARDSTTGANRRWHLRGPDTLYLTVGSKRIEVRPSTWFHATEAPSEALYEALGDVLALEPEDHLLDIGCGVGTISLLAADRIQSATGFDAHRDSVEQASLNAMALGAENTYFFAAGWETGLRKVVLERKPITIATINPMRAPLGERSMTLLRSLAPTRIVYLGPSPVSCAKDLRALHHFPYQLDDLACVDLHPSTYHAMMLARLIRYDSPPSRD